MRRQDSESDIPKSSLTEVLVILARDAPSSSSLDPAETRLSFITTGPVFPNCSTTAAFIFDGISHSFFKTRTARDVYARR
jgi:hypothetical protein